MFIDTTTRIDSYEIMDDFALEGCELRDALDKIAKINQLLGGNKLTLQGVKSLVPKISNRQITIVDVGCGNGDMLRALADFGKDNNLDLKLIGIDANAFTVNYARGLSANHKNISYQCEDVFGEAFKELDYDIVLCTLTLHHFKDAGILYLVDVFKKQSRIGIVINDLQRSAIAYRLFQLICFIFRLNDMSREDGLVSILRGFKKKELQLYSKQLNLKKYTIRWKWAFRYQWIISTI
ncbi:MAG TPA: methyltransferase domain-containing protein [Flavobacterium sp.]|nr:methyltransferase domain-containing protein [Flavobacterium sp.]